MLHLREIEIADAPGDRPLSCAREVRPSGEARAAPPEISARDGEPILHDAAVDHGLERLFAPVPAQARAELRAVHRAHHLALHGHATGDVEHGLLEQIAEELPWPVVGPDRAVELAALESTFDLRGSGVRLRREPGQANRVGHGPGPALGVLEDEAQRRAAAVGLVERDLETALIGTKSQIQGAMLPP